MNAILEFEHTVNGLYGVYLDSVAAFKLLRGRAEQQRGFIARLFYGDTPTAQEADDACRHYKNVVLDGEPENPDSIELQATTLTELLERNEEGGMNYYFAAVSFVVTLYSRWEHFHRRRIATSLGLASNGLSAPIMGDLRRYRNSLLHNKGKANDDVLSCTILTWHQVGEEISFDESRIQEIVGHVRALIRELKRLYRSQERTRKGRVESNAPDLG